MRRPALAALLVVLAAPAGWAQSRLEMQPVRPSGVTSGPAAATRLTTAPAPPPSRVAITALARSTVTIGPLQATAGTASGAGPTSMRTAPAPAPSRIVIAAIAPSRVRIEPLAATETMAVATLKSELGARETDRGTLISLPGDILFDFDKYAIREEARPTLAKLAELIRQTPSGEVLVEGHTDAKGSDAYNLRLSERRAEAVADWLGEQEGVDAARVGERGLGEAQPTAPNANPDGSDNPEGRQLNRRVEVILTR